jgi:DNA-binding transcriptional MerR regulator
MAEWLLPHEAARRLQITPEGVRALERRGKLAAERTESGHRLFALTEIQRLKRERQGADIVSRLKMSRKARQEDPR